MSVKRLLEALKIVLLILAIGATPCMAKDKAKAPAKKPKDTTEKKVEKKTDAPAEEPCITDSSKTAQPAPADKSSQPSAIKRERLLWANSYLWAKAPEFVVEKWLSDKPDTKGKYVLIEYWATWCGPCRKSIPLLNKFQKKYGDELVVIGISEESEEDVLKMTEPQIDFHLAIDTKKRMKDELGVFGIPHIIILEPNGYVIWEGFPLQNGYELTDKIIEKILAVGRKLRAKKDAEKAKKG